MFRNSRRGPTCRRSMLQRVVCECTGRVQWLQTSEMAAPVLRTDHGLPAHTSIHVYSDFRLVLSTPIQNWNWPVFSFHLCLSPYLSISCVACILNLGLRRLGDETFHARSGGTVNGESYGENPAPTMSHQSECQPRLKFAPFYIHSDRDTQGFIYTPLGGYTPPVIWAHTP